MIKNIKKIDMGLLFRCTIVVCLSLFLLVKIPLLFGIIFSLYLIFYIIDDLLDNLDTNIDYDEIEERLKAENANNS